VVTAAFDEMSFHAPIEVGELALLDAKLTLVDQTSMEICVPGRAERAGHNANESRKCFLRHDAAATLTKHGSKSTEGRNQRHQAVPVLSLSRNLDLPLNLNPETAATSAERLRLRKRL
jgi:acyl-CoA hydrolase